MTTQVGDKIPAPLEFERVPSAIFAGLRQDWLSGKSDDGELTFELTAGAGLGTPYMILSVKLPDGSMVYEVADVRPMVQAMVTRIAEEAQR